MAWGSTNSASCEVSWTETETGERKTKRIEVRANTDTDAVRKAREQVMVYRGVTDIEAHPETVRRIVRRRLN